MNNLCKHIWTPSSVINEELGNIQNILENNIKEGVALGLAGFTANVPETKIVDHQLELKIDTEQASIAEPKQNTGLGGSTEEIDPDLDDDANLLVFLMHSKPNSSSS
eukprot:TRINITY_DN16384_c0_g1_i1.p1 TRINITY_DN16384_c0_g1~~TRINITY_DN16384_c0_g1_i1.p1  ORF type:complete len:107 (-),score=22.45 TRINITY_DN16384_c0_g1_i1:36-356(-)